MHGFSPQRLEQVTAILQSFVDRGEVAGAVALVNRHGHDVFEAAVGAQTLATSTPMSRRTVFRLASMTKPIVAAALLTFVAEGRLGLFDPIAELAPEFADPKVMKDPTGAADDVKASPRPITVHDVLTYRMGTGWGPTSFGLQIFALAASPIAQALRVKNRVLGPDDWMRALAEIPLQFPPGARWQYHVAGDVLGVLVARLGGNSLEDVLRERIFEPLGMKDTSFVVRGENVARLATLYVKKREGTGFNVADDAAASLWSSEPVFPSGAAGLVGTADDYQRFGRMLVGQGELDGRRVLPRKLVEAMTTDYLTPQQHDDPFSSFDRYDQDGSEAWTHRGFGYGLSVRTSRVGWGPNVGSFFWPGAFGTTWTADPSEGLMMTLLVQLVSANPFYTPIAEAFTEAVYRALDD